MTNEQFNDNRAAFIAERREAVNNDLAAAAEIQAHKESMRYQSIINEKDPTGDSPAARHMKQYVDMWSDVAFTMATGF